MTPAWLQHRGLDDLRTREAQSPNLYLARWFNISLRGVSNSQQRKLGGTLCARIFHRFLRESMAYPLLFTSEPRNNFHSRMLEILTYEFRAGILDIRQGSELTDLGAQVNLRRTVEATPRPGVGVYRMACSNHPDDTPASTLLNYKLHDLSHSENFVCCWEINAVTRFNRPVCRNSLVPRELHFAAAISQSAMYDRANGGRCITSNPSLHLLLHLSTTSRV